MADEFTANPYLHLWDDPMLDSGMRQRLLDEYLRRLYGVQDVGLGEHSLLSDIDEFGAVTWLPPKRGQFAEHTIPGWEPPWGLGASRFAKRSLSPGFAQGPDQLFVALSLGVDTEQTPLPRAVPVSIYLEEANPNHIVHLTRAVRAFCAAVELEQWRAYEPQWHSYFRPSLFGTKQPMTKKEEAEHYDLIGIVLRGAAANKSQDEIAEELFADVNSKRAADPEIAEIEKSQSRARKSGLWAKSSQEWAKAAQEWAKAGNDLLKTLRKIAFTASVLIGPWWLHSADPDLILKWLKPEQTIQQWQQPAQSSSHAKKAKAKHGPTNFCYVDKEGNRKDTALDVAASTPPVPPEQTPPQAPQE